MATSPHSAAGRFSNTATVPSASAVIPMASHPRRPSQLSNATAGDPAESRVAVGASKRGSATIVYSQTGMALRVRRYDRRPVRGSPQLRAYESQPVSRVEIVRLPMQSARIGITQRLEILSTISALNDETQPLVLVVVIVRAGHVPAPIVVLLFRALARNERAYNLPSCAQILVILFRKQSCNKRLPCQHAAPPDDLMGHRSVPTSPGRRMGARRPGDRTGFVGEAAPRQLGRRREPYASPRGAPSSCRAVGALLGLSAGERDGSRALRAVDDSRSRAP
jgi:hypothetical protein